MTFKLTGKSNWENMLIDETAERRLKVYLTDYLEWVFDLKKA